MRCSDTTNAYHDRAENNNKRLFLSAKRKCYCKSAWHFKRAFPFFYLEEQQFGDFQNGSKYCMHIHKIIDDIEEMIMIEKNLSIPFKTMFNNNPCNLPLIIKNKHF